jgi:hypothetical protein
MKMWRHKQVKERYKPGKPLGAGAGEKSACELGSPEGPGEGAPPIWSLSHNSEQLVFQNPIFSLWRS